jgi:ABC-2 type transport system ATP-binding protein
MVVIEARELTKRFRLATKTPGLLGAAKHLLRPRYEEKLAVDHIDLNIKAGETVGYVGPNGAGKSTTVKMLTGIIVPTSGIVRVRGLVPHRQRVKNARNIGLVFGQRSQLWWDLPVQESLRLLGDIYEVPAERFERNLREMIELLDLGPLLRVPARQLSLGQRVRCDLAASLLHGPSILYLDEPTIGLDVAVKERIRQFVKRVNQERGVTVLLASHDLGDIEDLCVRLVMIDGGRIVFDGPLKEVKKRFGRERMVHLTLYEGMSPGALEVVRQALTDLPSATLLHLEPFRLSVRYDASLISSGVVAARLLPVLPVEDLRIDEPSIEHIIRQLYEGRLKFVQTGVDCGTN